MTQTTKKLAKNAPCPCGSGRKYKRCCMENDMRAASSYLNQPKGVKEQPKLKNTFRKETHAKDVSDAELMYRDQVVLLMELEGETKRRVADALHYKAALEDRKAEKVAYQNLPDSEGRRAAIVGVEKNIEFLTSKFEEMDAPLPRVQECQLEALRQVVAVGNYDIESDVVVGETEDTVNPVDQKSKEKVTQTKPMEADGPIQTDGDNGLEDDDDESLTESKDEDKAEPAIVVP